MPHSVHIQGLERTLCVGHARNRRGLQNRDCWAQAQIVSVAAPEMASWIAASHVVIGVSAAILTKHFHHQQLGLGATPQTSTVSAAEAKATVAGT